MALNFPDSPTLNQVYTDSTSGFSYQWDGVVWQSYSAPATKNISIVDNIESSFNGSTQTFALAVSGVSLTPVNAQQLRVVLGGIVQEPVTNYTVSGPNITFITAPSAGLDCSIVSLGPAIPLSTLLDGSVTPAKLSTGGPSWDTDGDVVITGTGTTALIVNGNARVTGILTVGPSSLTLDGINNTINGVTISSGILTATAASISGNVTVGGNVSIAGTLTYEDVTNVDSIGIVTARSGVRVTDGIVVVGSAVTLSSGGLNIAGVTTVSAGSASVPSITPTGDNNTGIFFPAADTIAFAEGGVEAARFDSSGRLGIGTTGSNARLHVRSSADDSTPVIRAQSNNQTQHVDLGFYYINYDNGATSSSFEFQIDGSTRAVLTSAGGFSVGTTANPGAGAIFATGDITAFYSSDIRLKKDIQPISEPIKKLMEISGVTYKWNEEYLKDKDVDGYFVRETEVGVIAQDVEKVLPEVVATRENGYKAVRYEKLVALLIEAVKDQQKQIDELKARLEDN